MPVFLIFCKQSVYIEILKIQLHPVIKWKGILICSGPILQHRSGLQWIPIRYLLIKDSISYTLQNRESFSVFFPIYSLIVYYISPSGHISIVHQKNNITLTQKIILFFYFYDIMFYCEISWLSWKMLDLQAYSQVCRLILLLIYYF